MQFAEHPSLEIVLLSSHSSPRSKSPSPQLDLDSNPDPEPDPDPIDRLEHFG